MLLTAVKAHIGLIPINFTVLSENILICILKNLPYRYFHELLVLYLCFQSSRQIGLFRVSHLVRKPRSHSHQWVILAPQASIIRRPQGFCYWPLYNDTRPGTTHGFHAFHDFHISQTVDVTASIPIATILLFLSLSARLKNRSSLS